MGVFLDFEARLKLLLEVFQYLEDSTALLSVLLGGSATASSSSTSLVKGDRWRHAQRFCQYVAEQELVAGVGLTAGVHTASSLRHLQSHWRVHRLV